jgi:hypothetical protein
MAKKMSHVQILHISPFKPGVAGWRLNPARKGRGRLALDPSTSALCAYAQDDTLGKAEARGRLSPSNLLGALKTYLERFLGRFSATFGA